MPVGFINLTRSFRSVRNIHLMLISSESPSPETRSLPVAEGPILFVGGTIRGQLAISVSMGEDSSVWISYGNARFIEISAHFHDPVIGSAALLSRFTWSREYAGI